MSFNNNNYKKGRGAQLNTDNEYLRTQYCNEAQEYLDEPQELEQKTQYFHEHSKTIVNKVDSPDLSMLLSMNPYQGCEHGCIYCYARNTHKYWGFSAGFDFESKIIIKENAAELLEQTLKKKTWVPKPIMLSGNTDCYQPIERKRGITREMLKVLLKHRNPVGIITKNSLILRDLDLLKQMAELNLVRANISFTTLNEDLRRKLEPRTASGKQRLKVMKSLSEVGVPVNAMIAPIIPALNDEEIPALLKAAAENGAYSAAYTMVRLNGSIAEIFMNWLYHTFPDRADKVRHQIEALHGGKMNDSTWMRRMKGDGPIAEAIRSLFHITKNKYFEKVVLPPMNVMDFVRNPDEDQLSLF